MKAILAAGQQKLADARTMVGSVHQLDSSGQYARPLTERALVTNACFLNMFIGLEEFFEAAFAHYLTGKMSTARWRPTKFGRPPSVDHAHRMLIGARPFVDWSTPSTVVTLAELYFLNGEPFKTPIASTSGHLSRMKTVRNATAHVSKSTQASLDALHTSWTGKVRINVTAYEVLMAPSSKGTSSFYGFSEAIVQSVFTQVSSWK